MLFPTLDFGVFFLLAFVLSWRLVDHANLRKLFLLAMSYFFYAYWDWRFTALLAFSSSINYLAGYLLGRFTGQAAIKWIVGIAVALNLAILGFFKYFNFFLSSLQSVLTTVGLERELPVMEIILPVGISFFTFQGISYVVDVARREVEPVRSPIDLFLYISFFPQLVAGPIVRSAHFLPQLAKRPQLDPKRLTFGLVLILSGLFKKMVVANYLATNIVDKAFFDPVAYGGLDLAVAVYAYAVQIYCDFSGYSDIGIGVAALLGYHFHANFNQPYRARSLQDFWRRWHISLSEWLRDYLYKPLGGSRGSTFKTYRNLGLTMLLGGIWHGAAWTFIIWGAIHGSVLAIERVLASARRATASSSLHGTAVAAAMPLNSPPAMSADGNILAQILTKTLSTLVTFHIVCFAWIFFRAPDIGKAMQVLNGLPRWDMAVDLTTPFVLSLIIGTLIFQFTPSDGLERIATRLSNLGWPIMGLILGTGIFLIEAIAPEGVAPFIYFQF